MTQPTTGETCKTCGGAGFLTLKLDGTQVPCAQCPDCMQPPSRPAPEAAETCKDEREKVAIAIWHRLAPDHHMTWDDERDKARYLSIAEVAIESRDQRQIVMRDPLDDLVARFSIALLEKLKAARVKYGRGEDWLATDWRDKLRRDILNHLLKGDPRDVAAYCAFAWHHEWSVTPPVDVLERLAPPKRLPGAVRGIES